MEDILNRLAELKIYPFTPIEINFVINLGWVILRSFLKGFSDYRVTKIENQEGSSGLVVFTELKVISFLFSFLTIFAIFLSLDFWFSILDIPDDRFIWWLPSAIAIVLAEVSGIIALLFFKKEEDLSGPEEIKKISNFSIYFLLTFFSLLIFWLVMFFKYIFLT